MQLLEAQLCSWMGARKRKRRKNGCFLQVWRKQKDIQDFWAAIGLCWKTHHGNAVCEGRKREDQARTTDKVMQRSGEAWNIPGCPNLVQTTQTSPRLYDAGYVSVCSGREGGKTLCPILTFWPNGKSKKSESLKKTDHWKPPVLLAQKNKIHMRNTGNAFWGNN